jgi:MFS family permease
MSAAQSVSPDVKRQPRQSIAKVAGASLAGTTLEFYDHFIYGSAAALVFPKLFFPQADPLMSTLLSFASYGVAFVARPLGAAIFGHFGDRIGRKSILIITLLMMGFATFAIGLLPTYASVGVLAPILLVLVRIIQGLALGGEWGGAAIMVNEVDPEGKRRGMLGSLVQLAAPIGLLLANGIFALVTWQVSEEAFLTWGWRVPFLLSAILVGVGYYILSGRDLQTRASWRSPRTSRHKTRSISRDLERLRLA